jgi:hypothetical protein
MFVDVTLEMVSITLTMSSQLSVLGTKEQNELCRIVPIHVWQSLYEQMFILDFCVCNSFVFCIIWV